MGAGAARRGSVDRGTPRPGRDANAARPCGAGEQAGGETPSPPRRRYPNAAQQNLQLIYHGEATSILGKSVKGAAGEDMGRVVDILVDADGQPRAAVIDFGGFLGVGSRKIAVDWHLVCSSAPADRKAPMATRGHAGGHTSSARITRSRSSRRRSYAPPPEPPASPPAPPQAPPDAPK